MLASTRNSKSEMTIVSKDSVFYTPMRDRDRERLGKFIVSFFSVVRLIIYVGEETEREKERKKKKKRERSWGKSLFQCFQSFLFVLYVDEDTVRQCVCVLKMLRTVHIRQE